MEGVKSPQGRSKIARRFNGGLTRVTIQVPVRGRLKNSGISMPRHLRQKYFRNSARIHTRPVLFLNVFNYANNDSLRMPLPYH
jgi:hypothetical protein